MTIHSYVDRFGPKLPTPEGKDDKPGDLIPDYKYPLRIATFKFTYMPMGTSEAPGT
jgi:hypothetical protein